MTVMIGVDPHKGSHTAVAIDGDESQLAAMRCARRAARSSELLGWAARFEDRTWAVESAGGLGYLLAQQLVAAGERVLDVPATLAARVRVLGSGRSNKNDSNDAFSIAIAALRAPRLAQVGRGRSRGRVAAVREAQQGSGSGPEPHRVSAACAAGRARSGRNRQGNHGQAARSGSSTASSRRARSSGSGTSWRLEHLEDLRHLDEQMRASKRAHRGRGQRVGHHGDRPLRCRTGRRRDGDRLHPRRPPLRES